MAPSKAGLVIWPLPAPPWPLGNGSVPKLSSRAPSPLQRSVRDQQQGKHTINCKKSDYFALFWQFCELKWRQNAANVFRDSCAMAMPRWSCAKVGQGLPTPLCWGEPTGSQAEGEDLSKSYFSLAFWGSYNNLKCVRVYTIQSGLAGLWAWLLALCLLYCLWLCTYFN